MTRNVGKSTVSRYLAEKEGLPIVDADLIARQVVEPGRTAYKKIVKAFGRGILNDDDAKTINRAKLGEIIFADPAKRKILNACTHPAVRWEMLRQVILWWIKGAKMCVLDVPLLIESGIHKWVNVVVVVFASEQLQLQRITLRDNLPRTQALQRIHAQMPLKEKAEQAQYVIDNSGDLEETYRQVRDIVKKTKPSTPRWLLEWLGGPLLIGLMSAWLATGEGARWK
ncbi:hypothetical protein BZG36_04891 [Bifiguratus adelaidae]|uniref:Dephospho-CoA kinase n=1 Tax=Bifiguratus adelaidae TaxID=1938954 RepID=A0A261XUR5_9FUNG|nr:hypothetical protein BZG36_04891 [Bifiguratus adelaidae]